MNFMYRSGPGPLWTSPIFCWPGWQLYSQLNNSCWPVQSPLYDKQARSLKILIIKSTYLLFSTGQPGSIKRWWDVKRRVEKMWNVKPGERRSSEEEDIKASLTSRPPPSPPSRGGWRWWCWEPPCRGSWRSRGQPGGFLSCCCPLRDSPTPEYDDLGWVTESLSHADWIKTKDPPSLPVQIPGPVCEVLHSQVYIWSYRRGENC